MSRTLVAYFSASGVTARIAETIAKAAGADLYEIVPKVPYTAADLYWNNSSSRSSVEMNDKASRPEIAEEVENMGQYDTVFVGFPIWWYEAPRIIHTFLESYDFSGKTVIPFCTSASSGLGNSGKRLAELAGTGDWQEGMRFRSSVSDEDVAAWVESLV